MRWLWLLALLLWAAPASADPWLVCNPSPTVVSYLVSLDGCETFLSTLVPAQPDGSIEFDLETFPPGPYSFCLEAMNAQGETSEPSDVLRAPRFKAPKGLHFGN
jgi:hypothetical protein